MHSFWEKSVPFFSAANMSIATAFRSANRALAFETRLQTLNLYKSLLKSTTPYRYSHVMNSEIRHQFKKNRYNTSRSKVLEQLKRAVKTLELLEKGSENKELNSKILDYVKEYCIPKWTRKPYVKPTKSKKKKHVKRKSYQVAISVTTANGYKFNRVRGWRQPVRTAMMLKNRVKKDQQRQDQFHKFVDYLQMIRDERKFLYNLNCLPQDRLLGFETTIKMGINANSKIKLDQKDKDIEDEKK